MMTLEDGPVAGSYMAKRAPVYMRAVKSVTGKRDVLDLLNDAPRGDESIHVYKLNSGVGNVHVNRGPGKSGFSVLARYRHLPGVDGEALRSNDAWRKWVADRVLEESGRVVDLETGEANE